MVLGVSAPPPPVSPPQHSCDGAVSVMDPDVESPLVMVAAAEVTYADGATEEKYIATVRGDHNASVAKEPEDILSFLDTIAAIVGASASASDPRVIGPTNIV